jgi:hypothetical protein
MAGRGAKPGERRGGRAKGTTNKLTADLKSMILGALDQAGGQDYLADQAAKSPGAFLTLVGKVLPMQLESGPGGFTIQIISGVRRADDAEFDTSGKADTPDQDD